MNIYPRSTWQLSTMPVRGTPIDRKAITTIVAHYTGAATIPADVAGYLRAIQRAYVTDPKRGYSIGYNFAIDHLGYVWELRGLDLRCAANVGDEAHRGANLYTVAVLCLVNGSHPMNQAMTAAFVELGLMIERWAGRELEVVGHRDLDATACPGAGVYRQVQSGELDPVPPQPIPVTPAPITEEDLDVPFLIKRKGGTPAGQVAIVYGDGKVTGLAGEDIAGYVEVFGAPLLTDTVVFDDMANKGHGEG